MRARVDTQNVCASDEPARLSLHPKWPMGSAREMSQAKRTRMGRGREKIINRYLRLPFLFPSPPRWQPARVSVSQTASQPASRTLSFVCHLRLRFQLQHLPSAGRPAACLSGSILLTCVRAVGKIISLCPSRSSAIQYDDQSFACERGCEFGWE